MRFFSVSIREFAPAHFKSGEVLFDEKAVGTCYALPLHQQPRPRFRLLLFPLRESNCSNTSEKQNALMGAVVLHRRGRRDVSFRNNGRNASCQVDPLFVEPTQGLRKLHERYRAVMISVDSSAIGGVCR
jgi:hypothetical protein